MGTVVTLLGQGESSDWIQTLIYAVVFALSAFGWLSKKLIDHFGGRKSSEPDHPAPGAKSLPKKGAVLAAPAPVARPIAERPPIARAPLQPAAKPRQVSTARPMGDAARPRPARRDASGGQRVPQRPQRSRRQGIDTGKSVPPVARVAPSSKRSRFLGSGITHTEEVVDAAVLKHVPRLGADLSETSAPPVETHGHRIRIDGLKQADLRRAIVLNELLSLPLSLRPEQDRF